VHQEASDVMVSCDVPLNPLRVKGSSGWDMKKRKTASGDGDGGASISSPMGPLKRIETEMPAMRDLLRG
ncbi:hypothetical protein HAX54_023514, partial [Datura stramonium]|nr:hypothetical protein [Datura stramonium]